VPDACRKLGSSSATFPKWKANFKGLAVSSTKRLEALGAPSAPLYKSRPLLEGIGNDPPLPTTSLCAVL
jgi:hypothetical protein